MAKPVINYSPKSPHGNAAMDILKTKMPNNPRIQSPPTFGGGGMTDLSKPNIGQPPNGNTHPIQYNPAAPAASNGGGGSRPILGTGVPGGTAGTLGVGTPRAVDPNLPPKGIDPNAGNLVKPGADTGAVGNMLDLKPGGPQIYPQRPGVDGPQIYPRPPDTNDPQIYPPAPDNTGFARQHETLDQRLERLTRQGASQERLDRLQGRIDAGQTTPRNYTPPLGNQLPPKEREGVNGAVGNTPNNSPYKTGDLAELAPPVGTNTWFRDEGKSAQLKKRKQDILDGTGGGNKNKKKKKGGGKQSGNTDDGASGGGGKGGGGKKKKKGDGEDADLTDKQKKNLKKRPQPGTPQRPYINRGVTNKPAGYGGKLRV